MRAGYPPVKLADKDWVRACARAWNPLLKAEIKTFKIDEIEDARAWLREACERIKKPDASAPVFCVWLLCLALR